MLRDLLQALALAALLLPSAGQVLAQQKSGEARRPHKLPSAEKVVGDYLKAVGGKKRLAGIRDATYEWAVQLKGQPMGQAETRRKAPAYSRTRMVFGNGELNSAAGPRSAWTRGPDGVQRTLTDAEANAAKLQAVL